MAAANLRKAGVPSEHRDAAVRFDLEGLYSAHFHAITLQLAAYTGNFAEAQDIAQEAFVRAWQRWTTISEYADPSAWVRRVAWNLAKSRWRRQRTLSAILRRHREEHVDGPEPDRVMLTRALATLPEPQRRVFVLFYIGQLSVAEIAEQEQTPAGTVKSWLHRGRAALAELLTEEGGHV